MNETNIKKIALGIGALALLIGVVHVSNPCLMNPTGDGCPCSPPTAKEASGCTYSAWKSVGDDGSSKKHCHCYR